jgi:LmbE family N-acetylglucosaminyl deacetylase
MSTPAVDIATRNLPTPTTALAIAAHPDDVEFQCGATLAKWAADGCAVHHLICTDGSKGTWDANADTAALAVLRQQEQRDAAAALGATGEVHFLGRTDGELVDDLDARAEVAQIIRQVRPTVVLGHDPWKRYRLHPDHRAAGWLAVDGVVAARDPHFFPERGAHHRPGALLLFEADLANHAEDVAGFGAAKAESLLCHTSQFVTTMDITDASDSAQRDAFRNRVLAGLERDGAAVGGGEVELFHRLET